MICLQCHKFCLTCSGPTENDCDSCPLYNNRVPNPISGSCKCITGYVDIGDLMCVVDRPGLYFDQNSKSWNSCSDVCNTCLNSSTFCTSCKSSDDVL